MARPDPPSWTPPNERRLAALPHGFVDRVLAMVEEHGPVSARALTPEEQRVRRRGMFDFSDTKFALEWLFHTGRVTVAARPNFTRVYDLTERVLPAEVLASPTPTQDDTQRELVRIAARSFGVASASDLRNFWLLRKDEAHARLLELVDSGELLRVRVEGWRVPAYLWHQAKVCRDGCVRGHCCHRSTLCSVVVYVDHGCSTSTIAWSSTSQSGNGSTGASYSRSCWANDRSDGSM